MLRREWDCTQEQIVEAVRQNVRTQNQRKATMNNLGKASKMEEIMEKAGRRFKRIVTLSKPISAQVKELEAQMNEAQRRRSQLSLEMNMSSEYDTPDTTADSEE